MNITLYSTGCPRCQVLTSKLAEKGLSYTLVGDRDTIISHGFVEVPVLEVDGVSMDFREAVDWVNNQKGGAG